MLRTIHNHPNWKRKRNLQILDDWRELEAKGEDRIALKLAVKYDLTPARLYQLKVRTEEIENDLRKAEKNG